MLPNFLVVGAAKAGTGSLWAYLGDHPQIFVSDPKELQFFVADKNWSRGLTWYEKHFEGARKAIAVGEVSPQYAYYPQHKGVPGRIAKLVPEVRLIYLVRHPIERIISHLRMRVGNHPQAGHKPLDQVLLQDAMFINCSRYAMQIEQYLEYFPRERLLVVKSEDLRNERAVTLRRIWEFLGVDNGWLPRNLHVEGGKTPEVRVARPIARVLRMSPGYKGVASIAPPTLRAWKHRITSMKIGSSDIHLPERLRRQLEDLLRPDIQRLRIYMGEGFDGWGIA